MVGRNRESRVTLTPMGRKIVAAAGLILLLLGIVVLPQGWARDGVAPVAILIGLFWIGLASLAKIQTSS